MYDLDFNSYCPVSRKWQSPRATENISENERALLHHCRHQTLSLMPQAIGGKLLPYPGVIELQKTDREW